MILTRDNHLLRLAYIEDDPEAAQGLLDSWKAYRPQLQNPLDLYASAEAFLSSQQVPFAVPYDLVFVDLGLPGLQGDELIRILKAQPELTGQSIFIITASDEATARQMQRLSGAEGFAVKPVRAARILSVLGDVRDRYGLLIVDLDPPVRWQPPPTPHPSPV